MAFIVSNLKKFVNYHREVDNLFRTVTLRFHHHGVWPQFRGSTIIPTSPLFQKCCPWFMLVVSVYFTLVSSPMAAYIRRNDHIVDILEPLAFSFMTSMFFVHFSCLMFRGERFERVFHTLLEMRACAAKYAVRPEKVRARAKRYTDLVLAYVLQIGAAGPPFLLLGFSFLMYTRTFPFGSWYPYDVKLSPQYELTLLVWFVYVPIGGCVMTLNNALMMYFFSLAIAHTRLLRFTLENIRPLSMVAVNKPMAADGVIMKSDEKPVREFSLDSRLWGDLSGGSLRRGYFREMHLQKEMERTIKQCVVHLQKEMERTIKQCVVHQQIVIRFVDDISSAFGPILIHQLNCCLIPTAMSVILIVFAVEINAKTFMFVFMTLFAFVNLFLFSWLAQEVNTETMLVGESAFNCDWLEASKSFKKSILVVMTRCNQPLEVTVASFIPLNVNLCIQMIKMTYSYYMSAVEMMDNKKRTPVMVEE